MLAHVTFSLSGFAVVMIALTALWLTSALIGRVFQRRVAAAAPAARPLPVTAPGIPPAHVAAIAAAVAVVTEGRGRAVRVVLAPAHGLGAWSHAGRTAQLAGRAVPRSWVAPAPAAFTPSSHANEDAA